MYVFYINIIVLTIQSSFQKGLRLSSYLILTYLAPENTVDYLLTGFCFPYLDPRLLTAIDHNLNASDRGRSVGY